MIWLSVALFLFILQILIVLLKEHRTPSKLAAWLFIVYIVPYLGFVLYWITAQEYKRRRYVGNYNTKLDRYRHHSTNSSELFAECDLDRYHRLFELIRHLPVYPPSKSTHTQIFTDGQSFYSDLLQQLEASECHIHMQFYIFRDDEIGRAITDILVKKARQGVEVRCIIDGIGSITYPRERIRELHENGVRFHIFLPPSVSVSYKRVNYRNHRKVVICDGRLAYLGGMNIGVEHLGRNDTIGKWRDTQLRIEGECVYGLQQTFLKDWALVSGERLNDRRKYGPEPTRESAKTGGGAGAGELLQMIPSGPDQEDNAMFSLFYGMMTAARSSIYVTSPYVIPEESIKMALRSAALSGLDVRILVPGKPDSRIAKLATLSHLEELMQAGVRVYEYEKGFIHAKSVIIDSMFATVGSANMDMRSFFSNFEMNALVYSPSLVRRLESHFMQDLMNSREISYPVFQRRAAWQRMLETVARMLSPLF